MSASGVEFTFTGTKAEITIVGDNIATDSSCDTSHARIAIYLNDNLVIDALVEEIEKNYTVLKSETEQEVTIRVVKLSESADSTVGIKQVTVTSNGIIQPTPDKRHRIEFIGDSITCGFGVAEEDPEGMYSTSSENATKAYAYKTAETLNADYSMVSFSGYGIISGYSSDVKRIHRS